MSTLRPSRKIPTSKVPRSRSSLTLYEALSEPRPGNRTYFPGLGAALVALVVVGFLLVSDRPSVANATADATTINAESASTIALEPSPVTVLDDSSVSGSASINNKEITFQHAGNTPTPERQAEQQPEQRIADSPDAELISSYEKQIRELRLENDALQNNLESVIEETDYLKEETMQLNEELLRMELALWKANEAAKGPVEVQTVYNITNVPVGRFNPGDGGLAQSIPAASTSAVTRPGSYSVEQGNNPAIDDRTDKAFDLRGGSGELDVEVRYEDASPADQLAYDEYINDLGYHISYSDFRFSDQYKPADVN